MKKHSFGRGERTLWKTVIFGVGTALLAMLLFSLAAALAVSSMKDPLGASGAASLGVLVLSSFVSSFLAVKYKKNGGFFPAVISALIISAIIFAVSLIAGGGKLPLAALMNVLTYMLVALLAAFISARSSTGTRKRHRHR